MSITLKRRPARAPEPTLTPVNLPRINLLPPLITVRVVRRRLVSGLGAGAVLAVLLVLLLAVLAGGRQAGEQRRLDSAEQTNTGLQRQVATFAGVREVYAEVDAARSTLRSSLSTEVMYSRLLAGLSTHVPPTIQVTTLTYAQAVPGADSTEATAAVAVPTTTGSPAIGTIEIGGVTTSHDDVATWLTALAAQVGVANTTFSTSSKADQTGGGLITFKSSAVITAAALSGRYAGADGGLR